MSAMIIPLVVGGQSYHLFKSDIDRFPQNFFTNLADGEEALPLDRDGTLFRFVQAFIVTGHLPDYLKTGTERTVLEALREEARFYGLASMEIECSKALLGESKLNYSTLETFLTSVREHGRGEHVLSIDRKESKLTKALRWDLTAPFTCKGVVSSSALHQPLYNSSTASALVLPELIAAAKQSAFGRGTETVLDTKVRDSLEIHAEHLNQDTLQSLTADMDISSLWPGRNYDLRPYKLVIYQPGGHFDRHRDTVRGEGHIGTLVLILNSAYTGGELEITHAGRTEVVTGPYRWVAMYGDCLHKICPVTSGTRVSLIYDIYGQGSAANAPSLGGEQVDDVDFELPEVSSESESENEQKSTKKAADSEDEEEDEDEEDEEYDEEDESDGFYVDDEQESMSGPPPADANVPKVIKKALDKELQNYNKVVICLSHMYPAHQTVPGFLKGNDQVLYDLLKDHYRVQVVYCRIQRTHDYNYHECDGEEAQVFVTYGEELAQPTAVKDKTKVPSQPKTKLVIPRGLNRKCIMRYTPYAEHTGNESQPEEAVYVVAGLQIMRRA